MNKRYYYYSRNVKVFLLKLIPKGTPVSWQDCDRWRTKWITSFQDDDTKHRQAGRQTQTLSTFCHCSLNVPAYVHICACINANASGEIMPWGLSCPRSVGNAAQLSQVQIPGTTADGQAEGETVDHMQLSAAIL